MQAATRLFEATPTGVACRRTVATLAEEGLLTPEGQEALGGFLPRALVETAARIGHPDCVLQARIRTYRCYRDVWAYLLGDVSVCTAAGRPVVPRTGDEVRLVVRSAGAAAGGGQLLPHVEAGQYFETVALLLGRELGRHTPPEVAKQALRLCCRRRRGAAMERTPARPGGAQEPPEEEEDDEVAQALQRTAVRAWAVGTFAAPPRKVGSKTCDKRTCTLAAAVLYDGEREVAFRNLQLEMRVE